jgi:hypothetical protein
MQCLLATIAVMKVILCSHISLYMWLLCCLLQECMQWLDETPDEATKVSLIVALRDITDGKIFVESERARLTRLLADIKEANGDVVGAADVLQEVAVETYGALDKKEKADFILEQVRLTLLKKDYVRALIQSRKINRKVRIHSYISACTITAELCLKR